MKTFILAATALALIAGAAQADTFKTIWNQPVDSVANVAGGARVTSNRGVCTHGELHAFTDQCVNDGIGGERDREAERARIAEEKRLADMPDEPDEPTDPTDPVEPAG